MRREIVELLRSERRGDRIAAWTQLRQDFMGSQTLTYEEWELLSARLLDEQDEGVRHIAMSVMIGLAGPSRELTTPPVPLETERREGDSLANWLWWPFKQKSAVFSLTDPHYRRRDEVAIIALARHLCRHDFPKTDFHFMQVDDPHWDQLLFDRRYLSLCFVGRLGIFGDEAARRWGNKSCRFGFSMDHRPRSLRAGELHKDYHCIREQLADGSTAFHRTEERRGVRLDYGLVQRYVVRDGARHVPILACAGGSALGTLAATMWATNDLTEPLHPADSDPLPTPPGLDESSWFEALLHVTADITSYAWQPKHIELRKLNAGKYVWSNDDRTWKPLVRTHITLVTEHGQVVALQLDGAPATLKANSQNFRLLVRLVQGVLDRGDGVVDVTRLAEDTWIWGGDTRTEQEVRHRLSNLKSRHLYDCLVIGETVTLTAEVNKQEKASS